MLDAGSGSGKSTFELAKYARFVVGLEPWDPMGAYAIRQQRSSGVRNVAFVRGAVEGMPFRPQSLDHVVSVFGFPFWFVEAGAHGRELGRRFVADCRQLVKPGGWVVAVTGTPGQYAGELTTVISPDTLDHPPPGPEDLTMADLGFAFWDLDVTADYGTVDEAIATYGFIYGRRAIDHLHANHISRITWRLRVHELQIAG